MTQHTGNGHGDEPREEITLAVFSAAWIERSPGNLVQLGIQLAFQNGADAVLVVPVGHRVQEFYAPPAGKRLNLVAAGSNVRLTQYEDGTTAVSEGE